MKTTHELSIELYQKYWWIYQWNDPVIEKAINHFNNVLHWYKINQHKSLKPNKEFPNINFAIVETSKAKASVTKINDCYAIIVSVWLLADIQRCINQTLSIKLKELINELTWFYDDFIAIHIYECIIEYIFDHELTHVFYGHIDYLAHIKKLDFYEHDLLSNSNDTHITDIRILETHADTNWFSRCFHRYYRRPKDQSRVDLDLIIRILEESKSEDNDEYQKAIIEWYRRLNERKEYFKNSEISVKYLLISLWIYFTYLESENEKFTNIKQIKNIKHRDPRMRYQWIINTIKPSINYYNADLDPIALVNDCIRLLNQIIPKKNINDWRYNKENYRNHPDWYWNKERRDSIRHKLELFSYFKL